jgi:hypothetical protein
MVPAARLTSSSCAKTAKAFLESFDALTAWWDFETDTLKITSARRRAHLRAHSNWLRKRRRHCTWSIQRPSLDGVFPQSLDAVARDFPMSKPDRVYVDAMALFSCSARTPSM